MIVDLLFLVAAICLTVIASGLGILSVMLLVEILAGLGAPDDVDSASPVAAVDRILANYVVIIPAHNEVGTIEGTLAALAGQIDARGQILVVADNCTDETAAVCVAAGATVITRQDQTRVGKGFALDYAIRHLASAPPDVIVILDADCIPQEGALANLVDVCARSRRPLQARYDMAAPGRGAGTIARVGAFAWRVKNIIRPTGLARLRLHCLLMGTGMAFPWATIKNAKLATSHLVEDMVLGLDLAAAGNAPGFLVGPGITSVLPPSLEGQMSQRRRWETGHLQVIAGIVPRFLLLGLRRRDYRLCALALHVAVPPLVLLIFLLAATVTASGAMWAASGLRLPFLIALGASGATGLAVAAAWYRRGQDLLSIRDLVILPGYAFSKLSIYAQAIGGRKLQWTRTKRD